MRTPQRVKHNSSLRATIAKYRRQPKSINRKLELATNTCGMEVDDKLSNAITGIIDGFNAEIDKLSNDNFNRIFWKQQVHVIVTRMYITCTYTSLYQSPSI